jgi:hypothetical protein
MKRQQEKAEASNRGRDNEDAVSNDDDDLFLSDDASIPNSDDMRRIGQQMKKAVEDKKKKDGEALVATPTTSGKPPSIFSKVKPTGTTGE